MNTEVFDLGKIGITLGGEYNNKVIYEKLTIVLYKGKSYISTKTIQGLSPEQDIRSWQLVAEAKDAYHMLVDAGKTTLTEKEFLEQLVDATKGRYIVQGNIINAADEEDLTVEHSDLLGIDTLKLANRDNTNGMGYVILRKNKSFAEQVTKSNTIYEIRYDFDLNGQEITIPEKCTLKFEGGSISNGKITFLDTFLTGNIKIDCLCFGKVINNNSNVNWFCPKVDGISDDTSAFQSAINICDNIYVPKGTYAVCLQKRGAKTPNGIYINRSNVHLIMDTEAVIKGKVSKEVTKPSNGYTGYNTYFGHVIVVKSDNENEFINNITIEGGILIGVRDEFAEPIGSATEENQCGISVNFTNNCIIKNCIIKDNQGDAIIVYNSTDISIINTECINSRRSGISIGPCKNFLIESCKFINNGCDTVYNGNIKYATGPQAGICFEGDTNSTIVEKKFNNVIIQNCYCEYDSYLTPPSNYVFVARNNPAFVIIGNLANGSDKIVVRNCKIKNISSAGSSAFSISSKNTKCKNLYFIGNTYQSLVDAKNNASMFLLISSDIDNILIEHNTCTTNTRMIFIFEGTGKFGNITACNNKTLKVDGKQFPLYDFLKGKVNNLTICYNHSNGSINNSWRLEEINELNIINNYFEINSPSSGDAIVKLAIPDTATARFINNIYKIKVPLDYTFYLFEIEPTYVDDDNNIVESSTATKLDGPHLDFVNNTVSVKGSKNILFSSYPNYISGLIANNIIKVSDATSLRYDAPSKPLAKELYIHNNIFDIRGNNTKGNIISAPIENVFNFDNIYLGNKTFGDTLNTPKKLGIEDTGYPYYDKSLNYPIWWNGTNWVDSEGNRASKNKGTTAERPILNSTNEGFEYYDNTLKKKILWNGAEWTNMDGTALE